MTALLKQLFKRLDHSLLYSTSSPIPFKAVAFRHDMDNIFDEGSLEKFLRQDEKNDFPSTLFFLNRQKLLLEKFGPLPEKYEIALHSEARPLLLWTLGATKLVVNNYAKNLRRQKKYLGLMPAGHAPHAQHNYLCYNTLINWEMIAAATARCSFGYLSDWLVPSATPEGKERFATPYPMHFVFYDKNKTLVIPTAWDDKFFFVNNMQKNLYPHNHPLTPTNAKALESISNSLERCVSREIPFVINLHPCHWDNAVSAGHHLKQDISVLAKEKGLAILPLAEIAKKASLMR